MRQKSQQSQETRCEQNCQVYLCGLDICLHAFQLLHLFVDRMNNFFAVKCGGRPKSNRFWRCRLSGELRILNFVAVDVDGIIRSGYPGAPNIGRG